mmetsp:Transcript_20218/g.61562  ORF Transcript_20218/g.61562 Transcript_20218/m.61562 type:complete len:276 (-) Transcript_20218:317-1144(-)
MAAYLVGSCRFDLRLNFDSHGVRHHPAEYREPHLPPLLYPSHSLWKPATSSYPHSCAFVAKFLRAHRKLAYGDQIVAIRELRKIARGTVHLAVHGAARQASCRVASVEGRGKSVLSAMYHHRHNATSMASPTSSLWPNASRRSWLEKTVSNRFDGDRIDGGWNRASHHYHPAQPHEEFRSNADGTVLSCTRLLRAVDELLCAAKWIAPSLYPAAWHIHAIVSSHHKYVNIDEGRCVWLDRSCVRGCLEAKQLCYGRWHLRIHHPYLRRGRHSQRR